MNNYIVSQLNTFISEKFKETDDQKKFLVKLNEFIDNFNKVKEEDCRICEFQKKFAPLHPIENEEEENSKCSNDIETEITPGELEAVEPYLLQKSLSENESLFYNNTIKNVIISSLENNSRKFNTIREEIKNSSAFVDLPSDIEIRAALDELCHEKRIIFCPQSKTEPTQWKINPELGVCNNGVWGFSQEEMNEKLSGTLTTQILGPNRGLGENSPTYPEKWVSVPKEKEVDKDLNFSDMSVSEAILVCLKEYKILSVEKILSLLRKGNVKTRSKDFVQAIHVVLSNLKSKGCIQNVGHAVWRLTTDYSKSLSEKKFDIKTIDLTKPSSIPSKLKTNSVNSLVNYVLYKNNSVTINDIISNVKNINKDIIVGKNNSKIWAALTYLKKMDRIIKEDSPSGQSLWSIKDSYKETLSSKYFS